MFYDYLDNQDINSISLLIKARFTERFINPIRNSDMHGFTIMAICCLMIESIQSFREGRRESENVQNVFQRFLEDSNSFNFSSSLAISIYSGIRNGILHQAETKNGWKITRRGVNLVDEQTKTIDAVLFSSILIKYFESYCSELGQSEWQSDLAQNAVRKMKSIVRNCRVTL